MNPILERHNMTTPQALLATPELDRLLAESREDFLSKESFNPYTHDAPHEAYELVYSTSSPVNQLLEDTQRLIAVTLELIRVNPHGADCANEFMNSAESFRDVLSIAIEA